MKLKQIAWTAVVASIVAGTGAMAQTMQTSPTTPATPSITAPVPSTSAPTAPAAGASTAAHHAHARAAADLTTPININTASAADLDKLPGIGKARAAKIIRNRPYKSPDDLASKKVLPAKVYQKIKSHVVV
jgi:competence protein ComEA